MTSPAITIENLAQVDIVVGTITQATLNKKARKPAYILEIDFGMALGTKRSSAQITRFYTPEQLIGMQVVAVTNLPPRRVAGVKSEVLVLGAVGEDESEVILLQPSKCVTNGQRIA